MTKLPLKLRNSWTLSGERGEPITPLFELQLADIFLGGTSPGLMEYAIR